MPHPFVSAVVLAAGTSARMGDENKLLKPLDGRPVITHVVEALAASQADEVVVVLGHDADAIRAALAAFHPVFVQNPDYEQGMGTSIHAGVQAAKPHAAGYMICLSDLPLIETAELDRLIGSFRQATRQDDRHIVRPFHGGIPGHPVLFPSSYRPALLAQYGDEGCRSLLKEHRDLVVQVAMETDHVLMDVDTPEAFADVAARFAARHARPSAP